MGRVLLLAIVLGIAFNRSSAAQTSSTVIKVLDPTELEGIAGVILLINPGDNRKSQALVTDAKGEAVASELNCVICTITAFDPHGLFVSRTTEFSGSSPRFRLVLAIQPLLDIVRDPKAVSMELVVHDSKGDPLAQQDVVIRPAVMTLEDNRVLVQRTDATGRLTVHLRASQYVVATVSGDAASEARFEIVTSKERCSDGAVTCVVALPQSPHRPKPLDLQLASAAQR